MRPTPAEAELARLARVKGTVRRPADMIGPELIAFFKQSVEKRQGKLSKLAECWDALIPSTLADHCCLEGFSRGTLTVLVDSSSHLYELKQLLLAGLQDQLLLACKSAGLRKVTLKVGRWYDGADAADRKLKF
ncbi:MAG TPA: DciA family protein [Tepidisphaeraceae bacterium]|nr:DciA family protein [Tepidisphaeraceae bacterium]